MGHSRRGSRPRALGPGVCPQPSLLPDLLLSPRPGGHHPLSHQDFGQQLPHWFPHSPFSTQLPERPFKTWACDFLLPTTSGITSSTPAMAYETRCVLSPATAPISPPTLVPCHGHHVAFHLIFKYTKLIPVSGPLHLLEPPDLPQVGSYPSLGPQLRCHLSGDPLSSLCLKKLSTLRCSPLCQSSYIFLSQQVSFHLFLYLCSLLGSHMAREQCLLHNRCPWVICAYHC